MPKESVKSDLNYIKKIFNIEPIAWARYDDGRLSFISPTGQKFVYTTDMLEKIEHDLVQKAAVGPAEKKPSAAPKTKQPASKSSPKGNGK